MNCFGYLIVRVLRHLKRSMTACFRLKKETYHVVSKIGCSAFIHPSTSLPTTKARLGDRLKTQYINISSSWKSASDAERLRQKSWQEVTVLWSSFALSDRSRIELSEPGWKKLWKMLHLFVQSLTVEPHFNPNVCFLIWSILKIRHFAKQSRTNVWMLKENRLFSRLTSSA